jgi:predicted amidohydrolase
MDKSFKLAVCQMKVVDNKDDNLKKAVEQINISTGNGAELVVLPEMFNCPYDNQKFKEYAEKRSNSQTLKKMSIAAQENKIYLVAGSIPELDDDKIYNTSFIFNPHGDIIGSHRKLHLFDIDVRDAITFRESDTLTPGSEITIIDTILTRMGVVICYDIRFPELIRLMALEGVELLVVPGAFNMTTGPAHWKTLISSRAIDNQIFLAAASPARDDKASYVAYGHSMIVDPWGEVLSEAGTGEEIIYADIQLKRIDDVRRELPVLYNRREDVYELKRK